uniref:Calcium binding and coiled-coil domain 1 n=1 Tax=Pelodiscus sinensis TaxID=13735 RepID=K7FB92_PELSI
MLCLNFAAGQTTLPSFPSQAAPGLPPRRAPWELQSPLRLPPSARQPEGTTIPSSPLGAGPRGVGVVGERLVEQLIARWEDGGGTSQQAAGAVPPYHGLPQPNTKVECHYTLPPSMKPSARDWIGIFKVEASSVRDYYTFVWCAVPDGGAEGAPVYSSVQFQGSWPGVRLALAGGLDGPGGGVRGQSPPFQFCEPRPMDELVTLEEDDDEGHTDMLLVLPKATLLQGGGGEAMDELVTLEEDDDEGHTDLLLVVPKATLLQVARGQDCLVAPRPQDLSSSHAGVMEERDALSRQQAGQLARIHPAPGNSAAGALAASGDLGQEGKLPAPRKPSSALLGFEPQAQGKASGVQLMGLRATCRLAELSVFNSSPLPPCGCVWGWGAGAGRSWYLPSHSLVLIPPHFLPALPPQAQLEALCEQLRSTQDLLAASQQKVVLLGGALSAGIPARTPIGSSHSTLHAVLYIDSASVPGRQPPLGWGTARTHPREAATSGGGHSQHPPPQGLSLTVSVHLAVTRWSHDRADNRAQVSRTKRLGRGMHVVGRGMHPLQPVRQPGHPQDSALPAGTPAQGGDQPARPHHLADQAAHRGQQLGLTLSDSEDESPEDMRIHPQLSPYSLCDNRATPKTPPCLREPLHKVVISQPAPITSQIKQPTEDNSSDSEAEDEKAVLMAAVRSGGEEASLLLPELGSVFHQEGRG